MGESAPDFTLPSTEGRDIGLADFKGKQAVVLYFVWPYWKSPMRNPVAEAPTPPAS